ncbi:CHAD domain-containing protein [Streptomyces sp. NPDC056254]|uniref:CHAD domain-containing protein n=1 Tax=Streptomyces sp. NPDC056254 TaxID=3345763 RepID=UPI0035DF9025
MARPNPDPAAARAVARSLARSGAGDAGDVLGAYLRSQATAFLRGLRLHQEGGAGAAGSGDAVRGLRGAAHRISGTLATFRAVAEPSWADGLRTELVWLSCALADEHACTARLVRLVDALHRLSGPAGLPAPRGTAGAPATGSARAAALLERRLTAARTQARTATLQALGSSRFHALADAVAVLASEVPLDPAAARGRAEAVLAPLAAAAETRLSAAVASLSPAAGGEAAPSPYDAGHDSRWHEVHRLLRLHRYAREALGGNVTRTAAAGEALDRQRDAVEAAAAASAAARTPRIAPATAYTLGVLHADQRHQAEAARGDFRRLWLREPAAAPR